MKVYETTTGVTMDGHSLPMLGYRRDETLDLALSILVNHYKDYDLLKKYLLDGGEARARYTMPGTMLTPWS
jgi:hypothetical protein